MGIKIVLREYLAQLKAQELQKPVKQRRIVPNYSAMAEEANVSRTALTEFVNNSHRGINRDILEAAIELLRSRGFEVDVCDLIMYTPSDEDLSVPAQVDEAANPPR
jgi:hypothetical protein